MGASPDSDLTRTIERFCPPLLGGLADAILDNVFRRLCQCQSKSILDQLRAGVRYLDLRPSRRIREVLHLPRGVLRRNVRGDGGGAHLPRQPSERNRHPRFQPPVRDGWSSRRFPRDGVRNFGGCGSVAEDHERRIECVGILEQEEASDGHIPREQRRVQGRTVRGQGVSQRVHPLALAGSERHPAAPIEVGRVRRIVIRRRRRQESAVRAAGDANAGCRVDQERIDARRWIVDKGVCETRESRGRRLVHGGVDDDDDGGGGRGGDARRGCGGGGGGGGKKNGDDAATGKKNKEEEKRRLLNIVIVDFIEGVSIIPAIIDYNRRLR